MIFNFKITVMKTAIKFASVIFFCLTACSSTDDIEEEMLAKCYVVKILDTDLPITNTRITFYGRFGCCCGGCGFSEIGVGTTNDIGEVCVTLSRLDFVDVEQISCIMDGTYYEGVFDFSSNLTVIYVDTLF